MDWVEKLDCISVYLMGLPLILCFPPAIRNSIISEVHRLLTLHTTSNGQTIFKNYTYELSKSNSILSNRVMSLAILNKEGILKYYHF